jgi:Tfp pilus assembly protein PilE
MTAVSPKSKVGLRSKVQGPRSKIPTTPPPSTLDFGLWTLGSERSTLDLGSWTLDCGRSRAFTLVELLIIMGVIAVLAALLLPALSHAKASARRIECISLHRNWVVAFHEYAEDNDGLLPREGYHTNGLVFWNNWAQVQSAQSRDVWYNAVTPYLSIRPASSYALPASRLAFYERNSFFHCPKAPFPEATQSVM